VLPPAKSVENCSMPPERTSTTPPETPMPEPEEPATPPDSMVSAPPSKTLAPNSAPETSSKPPLEISVPLATPPGSTCRPPPLAVVATATAPDDTSRILPLVTMTPELVVPDETTVVVMAAFSLVRSVGFQGGLCLERVSIRELSRRPAIRRADAGQMRLAHGAARPFDRPRRRSSSGAAARAP
jgi:hypothetical protein